MKNINTNMTIGKKLTGGGILLVILVSACVGIVSYMQAYRAIQNQIDVNAPQIAKSGAKLIRSTLDRHLAIVTELANNSDIGSMKWERQHPVLESTVARLGYFQIGIVMPDGTITLNDGSQTNVKDREYFKPAMAGKMHITSVFIHRILNKPIMCIAVPMKTVKNRIPGFVLAVLEAAWLCEITDQIGYGEKGYSYIIDGKGTLIAHGNRDFILKQTNFIEEAKTKPEYNRLAGMFQRMIKGETGFDEYPFMGSMRFFSYTPVPDTSWSIAVGAQKKDVFQQVSAMRITIIIFSFVCISIGIILMILLARNIVNPVQLLTGHLKRIEEGDLTAEVSSGLMNRKDEIGTLTGSLQKMADRFKSVVKNIQDISGEVATASAEMSATTMSFSENAQTQAASAEEVTATVEEVSAGVENAASGSLEQFNRLGDFIGQIQKLSENINKMGLKLSETVNISSNIATTAKAGEDSLKSMNESMSRISDSSREMTGVVNMINDISDKINLLSLNAAIEAARAGDFGKGFAVVADEISKLADQTATSIKEIDKFIRSNDKEINNGMSSVQSAIDTISAIISGVNQISEMMEVLSEFMKQQLDANTIVNHDAIGMRNRSEEMKNATEEQKTAISEIVKSVSNINEQTQANASGAEEMAGTTESFSAMAENLKKTVEFFKL